MRVSILGPAYPLRGGIAHHVYWLWKELTGRGHTVQVISFRKLYPRILFPGTTQLDTSNLKLDPHALPILSALNPETWRRAFRQVTAFSPDVIVFQWWQPFFGPMVGTLARLFRRAGLKCIIECHNVISHEGSLFDRMLVRFALSAAEHFITHSTKDREVLLGIVPGKRVTVSGLPPVEEFYAPAITRDSGGNTILFFGTVRKYKGLDVLLDAMPKVLKSVECNLIVVGEFYDSIEKYRRLIREHRIESYVHLDNRYVPNEDVPGIFHNADVLVLPYRSATQSGVARIAIQNGLPVIASKTGGLSEAVIDGVNGLLFPPGDSDALADRLVGYFNEKLDKILGKGSSTYVAVGSDCPIIETIEKLAQTSLSASI